MVYPSTRAGQRPDCQIGMEQLSYPFAQLDHELHVFETDQEACRCGKVTVRRETQAQTPFGRD